MGKEKFLTIRKHRYAPITAEMKDVPKGVKSEPLNDVQKMDVDIKELPVVYIKPQQRKHFATSHKFRVTLFEALRAAEEKFGLLQLLDPCDLRSIFDDVSSIKVLTSDEKASVSETIILLGKFKIPIVFSTFQGNTQIAVKISFESLTDDNSLEIERQSYRDVTNPLLMNGNTPHVMLYVGALKCSNFNKIDIGESNSKKFIKEMNKISASNQYDMSQMWMLVLEQGTGKPLVSFAKQSLGIDDFWYPILFQIIYTLYCFQLVGFSQNDLHPGNLWVDELDEPQLFVYQATRNYMWAIETKYVVKFFDFDRAAKSATKYNGVEWTNKKLNMGLCASSGQCNGYQQFFDAFNILYNLYNSKNIKMNDKSRAFIQQWILNFVEKEYMEKRYAWHGQLCECVDGEPLRCRQCKLITPTNPVLENMLQHGFEPYRVDPNMYTEYVWKLPSFK